MSIASDPVSVAPIAAQAAPATSTTTKPPRRTVTAKADVIAQPEQR